MSADSKTAVVAALAGNAVIMVAKFVGFFVSGSGAMFAEAVHTAADVANQALLLFGIVRSTKAPTEKYQYGFGQERFVWALISAVGIFFLGCGVTLMHGIDSLFGEHEPPTHVTMNVVILVVAFFVEGAVLILAVRSLKKAAEGKPLMHYMRTEADPSAVAVVLEDSAATLGVLLALASIGLTELTGHTYWDAIGSISIALLLGAMAIWLTFRNRELLLGVAAPKAKADAILAIVNADPTVERVAMFKTKMLDTQTYDVLVELDFYGQKLAEQFRPQLKARYDEGFDDFESFYAFEQQFADDIVELLGDKIDELEAKIKEAVPEVKHIDVELD